MIGRAEKKRRTKYVRSDAIKASPRNSYINQEPSYLGSILPLDTSEDGQVLSTPSDNKNREQKTAFFKPTVAEKGHSICILALGLFTNLHFYHYQT